MNRKGLIAKISIKIICFANMYLEIFLADFAVFRVLGGISRDFVGRRSPDWR